MANEAAHRLFGAASESLSERLIQEFVPSFANVSDGRSSHPRFRAVMQSRGFRDDGEMFLADICFSTYPTASGNRLTAMLVDTSEDLREHEEASLRQLMTGSRLVAGAMSHEIRNVCAAIGIVHLNLVRSGLITANQDFEALGGLIQTLEDLAAVELSYTAPQSSEVDLVAALNDLRIVISPGLHELNIETAWTTDEELPKVWANRSQLMQIFLNLSSNSVRALSNVASPQFSVAARMERGKLVVLFTDNGGTIPECEKLFHPFFNRALLQAA